MKKNFSVSISLLIFCLMILSSCKNAGDARKISPDPRERVKQNIEEGRGFRLKGFTDQNKSGEFECFHSHNIPYFLLMKQCKFTKSFSQCSESHHRKSVIFEKQKEFLKFGRGWPKVSRVPDDGCGIVSLDNLTSFHNKLFWSDVF